jgi:hypothetical protein
MKIEKWPNNHTRLAFFKIAFDKISCEPLFAIFYREEEKRGNFFKYVFFDPSLNVPNLERKEEIYRQYFNTSLDVPFQEFLTQKSKKIKDDFLSSLNYLSQCQESFSKQIGAFLLDDDFTNTTYICEDSSSINLVRMISNDIETFKRITIVKMFQNIQL